MENHPTKRIIIFSLIAVFALVTGVTLGFFRPVSPSVFTGNNLPALSGENPNIPMEVIVREGDKEKLPEDIITPEQAMEKIKSIPGYEDAIPLTAKAVYDDQGKILYWGVKTSKGNVTVKAEK